MSRIDRGDSARRKRLIRLLEAERDSPRPFEQVADELEDLIDDPPLATALAAMARADRVRFWATSQSAWYRHLSWRLMRPMFAIALLSGVAFYFQKSVDPLFGYTFFLFGVAAMYATFQVYAHLWRGKESKKLPASEERQRAAIDHAITELKRRKN